MLAWKLSLHTSKGECGLAQDFSVCNYEIWKKLFAGKE